SAPPRPLTHPLFPYTTLFRSALLKLVARSFEQLDQDVRVRLPECQQYADDMGGRLRSQQSDAKNLRRCGGANIGFDGAASDQDRSEEHTSELQSLTNLVCRLL